MLIKLRNKSTTTIDVPGRNMVLKPGDTVWVDRLTGDIYETIEAGFLEIIDEVGGLSLQDGDVTASKLSIGLLARFAVVSWGTVTVVDPTNRAVSLQLHNLLGQNLAAAHVVRVTCDERAAMSVGEAGGALSGDGASDLIARTDSEGKLDLVVTCDQAISVSLAAGPTQMSPMLDCGTGCEVSFQP